MSGIDGKDPKVRKAIPLATGVLDYFPDALCAVAELSRIGNDQHNPGQPLHWARGKSNDHADCLLRHMLDRGGFDTDGVRHSAKVAWRALALLQLEIEAAEAIPDDVEARHTVVGLRDVVDTALAARLHRLQNLDPIKVGDLVRHKDDGDEGVVIELKDGGAVVDWGADVGKLWYLLTELGRVPT